MTTRKEKLERGVATVGVELPVAVQVALKRYAATKQTSMRAVMKDAIQEHLERNAPEEVTWAPVL